MAEEFASQPDEAATNQSSADAVPAQEEGGARAILREAIQKVMGEIEHHETEARQHLRQAAELRKALRESISFLHEQGETRIPGAVPKGGRPDVAASLPAENRDKQGVSMNKHRRSKKR
jgi:hypothetical protein